MFSLIKKGFRVENSFFELRVSLTLDKKVENIYVRLWLLDISFNFGYQKPKKMPVKRKGKRVVK